MIHVGIQGPFNFPPNYSQVNSNHPFPTTIQYIPNYCIVIVIPWTRLLLPLLLNVFSICRAKETTFDFAKDVFTDVAKLFPARLVPCGAERTLFSLERKKKIWKRLVKNGNLDGFVHLVIFFRTVPWETPTKLPFGRIRCLELVPPALHFQLWKVKAFSALLVGPGPYQAIPKRKLVFQPSISGCYVSFREFKWSKNTWVSLVCVISTPLVSYVEFIKTEWFVGAQTPPPGGSTLEVTKWCQRNGGARNMWSDFVWRGRVW